MPFQFVEMPPYYAGGVNWNTTVSQIPDYFKPFRDRARSTLDPDWWRVSDITLWEGASTDYGVGFIIRALNGGSALNLGSGDDVQTTFSGVLVDTPVLAGSVVVTDGFEIFTDTYDPSDTSLIGDQGGSGTIDYTTGNISVTFNSAPTGGQSVDVSYSQLTGPEWFICWSTYRYDDVRDPSDIFANNSTATLFEYYRDSRTNTENGVDDFRGSIIFRYAPNGFTGFDFYGKGDGTQPNSGGIDPYSSISTFMNQDDPRGVIASQGSYSNSASQTFWGILANTEYPYLCLMVADWERPIPGTMAWAGKIIDPIDPTDTNEDGMFWFSADSEDDRAESPIEIRNTHIDVINPATSAKQEVQINATYQLNSTNSPRASDNTYPWEPIRLAGGGLDKGWLKVNVAREMGGVDAQTFSVFTGPTNPFVKWHPHFVFEWLPNRLPWPIGFMSRI